MRSRSSDAGLSSLHPAGKGSPSLPFDPVDSSSLMLLYRVSATMLTTTSIDRLIHVILTALTSDSPRFFDRAALFLVNERSGFLQGMLGVTRDTSYPLAEVFRSDPLLSAGRWEIPDEVIERQCTSEFTRYIKGVRLEIDRRKNASSRAVLDRRLVFVKDTEKSRTVNRDIVRQLGVRSFAVAPLVSRDRVFGVIAVDNALSGNRIRQSDLGFLQLFANHAGMAAENALLYQRLAEANRRLAETQESLIHQERLATIGEMSACLAHEIKTPLITIAGFAKRLSTKLKEGTPEHAAAEIIAAETTRLEKMIADILAFGKKTTLCYDTVILNDLLDETLDTIRQSARERGVRIERAVPSRRLAMTADSQQLRQVFLNLFLNALDAMGRKQGGVLTVSFTPVRWKGKRGVELVIADTGGGVPEKELHRLFEPFYTTKDGGTGLGLPIVRRIVDAHGGVIHAENGPEGLVMTVTLPLNM